MSVFIDRAGFIRLVKENSLEYGDFVLSGGATTHFYLDLRKLTLSKGMCYVAEMIDRTIRATGIKLDAVGGPEAGANQIVGGYMTYLGDPTPRFNQRLDLRGFTVRKQQKKHGKEGLIVGNLQKGDVVGILEDVTSTGASTIHAIEAIQDFGAKVALVISLVDRESGARKRFEKMGIVFSPILTLGELNIEQRKPEENESTEAVPEPKV